MFSKIVETKLATFILQSVRYISELNKTKIKLFTLAAPDRWSIQLQQCQHPLFPLKGPGPSLRVLSQALHQRLSVLVQEVDQRRLSRDRFLGLLRVCSSFCFSSSICDLRLKQKPKQMHTR